MIDFPSVLVGTMAEHGVVPYTRYSIISSNIWLLARARLTGYNCFMSTPIPTAPGGIQIESK